MSGEAEKPEPKGLLAKIKGLFGSGAVPEKTELMIAGVSSIDELRQALDQEILNNEVNLGQIEREQEKIGAQIEEQKDRIRGGSLNDRAKSNALRGIKRLQSRSDSYERRLKIFRDNIDLHYAVLNKIDEMEAMELKAIDRDQIDEIAVDYEERLEEHRDIVNAGRVASESSTDYEDLAEQRELEDLERLIMAETEPAAPEPQEKAPEPVQKVAQPEAPVSRRPAIDELIASDEPTTESRERRLELEQ